MNLFNKMAEKFLTANRRLKKWQRVVSVLAAVVVFVTTYALVLPAITLDKETASTQAGMEIAASEQEPGSDGTVYEADPEEEPDEVQAESGEEEPQEESASEDSGSQEAEVSEDQSEESEDADSGQDTASNEGESVAETVENAEVAASGETTETAKSVEEVQLITEKTQLSYRYIDENFETDPDDNVDDGYTVYAEFDADAKLPVGVGLRVKEITKESDPEAYEAYYEKTLSEMQDKYDENTDLSFARFYDISFVYNGEEIEPSGYVKVRIEYNKPVEVKTDENVDAVHFDKYNDEKPEVIDSEVETEKKGEDDTLKTVEFESGSFSVYGIIGSYTVDFHWEVNGEEYELSIPGGGFVSFTELVEVLGVIDGTHKGENIAENEAAQSIPNELTVSDTTREFVADVANVEFSSPELVSVSKVEKDTTVGRIKEELHLECEYSLELTDEQIKTINEGEVKAGDWALISLKAFDTEETLTITMNNGEVFVIKVTDDQENPLGLDGKTFSILGQKNNTQYCLNNTVTSSNTLSATAVNSSTSRGTPWTFEWAGTGKNYLIHDNDGKFIIIQDDNKVTLTTDRIQALDNPITVNSIDGKYSFVNKNNIGLNIYGNSGFGGWPYSTSNNDFMMTLQSPEDLTRPGTIATADSSDEITINLFDYGPEDQLDTVDHHNGNPADAGVNIGHTLKFFSYGHDVGTGINDFTGTGNGAQVGIVNDRLGSDNYPVLAGSEESLNYLFGGVSNQYVTGYYGLNHLFTKDEDEYYHYDSDTNYAYYDSSNGNRDFKVYSKTFREEGADEQYFAIGFFPFNDYDEYHNCIHGINFNWDTDTTRQGYYNHHFGMEMKAEFTYLPGGQYNGNDISYHFSGDDDMWVFVDGILVMDIGGIHNPVAGDINFRTGEVTVHGSSQENFKDKYKRITGKDWDDSDYSTHDFRVFYMERGGMYSNLEVEFNLPTFKTIAVEKQMEGLTEEQRELYKGVEFKYELLLNGELYNGNQTVRQDKNGDVIEEGFEISNGEISIKDGEVVAITHLTRQDVFSVSEKNLDMSQYNVPNAERVHLNDNGERITEDITLTETTAHYQPVEGRKTWISGTYNVAETEKVTIKNKPLLGSLRIDKKVTYNGAAPVSDEEKALLAGTYVFKIFKDEDCTIPYKENGEDKTISITINNDGTAQSSELVSLLEGVYWIQEETPDNGAAPIQNKFEVSVTPSHTTSAPAIVTFTNNIEGEVSIDIYKIDKSDNTKKLSGAVFTLRKIADKDPISEGTYESEEGFDPIESEPTAEGTGKTGFANLKSGYYELTEKTPPAGYIKTEDLAVYFKIKNGKVTWLEKGSGKPSTWEEKTEDTMVSFEAAKDDENASFSVKNEPGAVLPNAGGPGTKLFTILGVILIAGAGVLLLKRCRMAKVFTVLSICLILSMTGMTVLAAGTEIPDLDRNGSLSITFSVSGEPISDGNEVGIYKVADAVEDEGYKFVYRGAFAEAGEMPENLDTVNEELALKLEKIAEDRNVPMYTSSQKLDENGKVTFSDLEVGLYLIVHTKKTEITLKDKTKVVYTINPFLVSIPQNKDGKLIYDVASKPKVSPEKKVTPPKKTPPPKRIPQTGQLWWPVMALSVAGAILVTFGLIRKMKSR